MPRVAAVVGAGPVGCLAALSLAKMGWEVQVFEGRSEQTFNDQTASSGRRSINLAISARGITALETIVPEMSARFLQDMIPMRGRFVHSVDGSESRQLYDGTGQCINSVDRGLLNRTLLKETMTHPGIWILFEHKLVTADFDKKVLTLDVGSSKSDMKSKQVHFDLCIGADGSYSNVRRQLMRVVRMNFQQEYIPHDYLELHVPSRQLENGELEFALDPNYLHIWPRHAFMLIALPNKDKSFTCTLFAPSELLDQFSHPYHGAQWFATQFPDLVPLIGAEKILRDFTENPRSPMICIKAKPYHYKDRAVILGDAAHSMVPFYGQGLNCGFEDVRILDTVMRLHSDDLVAHTEGDGIQERLAAALEEYSRTRHNDLVAISDLAMQNYVEMRHSVTTPMYLLRKFVDNVLSRLTPHRPTRKALEVFPHTLFPSNWAGGWLPLYTMVTFRPDMSYSSVKRQAAWQNNTLKVLICLASLCTIGIGIGVKRSAGID